MGRIHLFEFEDQKWFPQKLRNYGTDFLQFLSNFAGIYKSIVPLLSEMLRSTGNNRIVDLGSGGGGGLLYINRQLQKSVPDLQILLTDYYPNLPALKYHALKAGNINYITKPVDARLVPRDLNGLRTLFLLFHHFKPKEAQKILEDAIRANQPIAIFEGQERSIPSLLAMFFSPVSVLFTTPFIRPFSAGRLFFTYLIPLVPLFVWWDGIVSSLRTYSAKEMEKLLKDTRDAYKYHWEMGKLSSGPAKIPYLLGKPMEHI